MDLLRLISRAPGAGGVFVALAIWWSGCSAPPGSMTMAVTPPVGAVASKHPHSFNLNVTGGAAASPLGVPQIADGEFADAIRQSVMASGLFANIQPPAQADYLIDVALVRLSQPLFGGSMTVTLEANWTLRRRVDGVTVWQKAIINEYTAGRGEAANASSRIRLANKGAARANIQEALIAMGALKLP